jgi:hypothetical protein
MGRRRKEGGRGIGRGGSRRNDCVSGKQKTGEEVVVEAI